MAPDLGPPAGWYPHPSMPGTQRYWDGAAFTGHTAPRVLPRTGSGQVSDTLQTVGWVCAFLFPIAGFVIGCLCVSQGPKSEGVWIIVVSTIFTAVGFAVLIQAAPTYY